METIFCMDNSDTIRKLVQDCVMDLGYHFEDAENGRDGLARIGEIDNLKMVVLDWNMPVLSGRETLRQLRQREDTKDVLILALIKIENKDQVMEAVDLGVNNYMLKPFRVNDLQDKIEEMINNAA